MAKMKARKEPSRKRQRRAVLTNAGDTAQAAVGWLQQNGSRKVRDGMARFAIPSDKALGVTVGDLRRYANGLRTADATENHLVAAALWETDCYEARMLACFVDEPDCVTPAQMNRWCGDFDNWAICDTACFALFDRTRHAWSRVQAWSSRRGEFARRASFALLWALSMHDKSSGDEPFLQGLALIEQAATDERNFVKKAVSMALRATGKRNANLHAAAVAVAKRLSASANPTARWVGKDALRELTSASVKRRLAGRRRKA